MGNQFKTLALLAALSGLLIAISYWIIGGSGGLVLGIGLAAITNLFSWYQSDKIALAVYNAQPVSEAQLPVLHRMVAKLSSLCLSCILYLLILLMPLLLVEIQSMQQLQ
ncbi:hypothetical protein CRC_02266 [Cylindrospermopsis raciborskii CS-505]|nr:hypothetical protein CRC_02266 [Cylindrospermopsis raciborskii CS-505]